MGEKESQKKWINRNTLIDKDYIKTSNEFRRKFDKITNDKYFARLLWDSARTMLSHRSGTNLEDMYWFDIKTKKIFAKKINSKDKQHIKYDDNIQKKIKDHELILTMHTHPNSFPPSIDDFDCNFKYNYYTGLVICHNGKIYKYSADEEITDDIKNQYYILNKKNWKLTHDETEAQINTILKLSNMYNISFEEVL